jgi:hypothetical protein
MSRYINDGSARPPRLRVDLNLGTLDDLPDWSAGPRGPIEQVLAQLRAAGFEGIQAGPAAVDPARRAGMSVCGSGRVDTPDKADALTRQLKEAGLQAATLHVGTGFEDEVGADALLEAVIAAAERHGFPLFVETHRATITQDSRRTLRFIERYPRLALNGDFSHWYTGLEMVYGDFDWKVSLLRPVFERVGFMHGRIGDPGCIQVDIGDGADHPAVAHFRRMWSECFRGFLRAAGPGDVLVFAPELLPPRIHYARTVGGRETSDRWLQALVLARLAWEWFEATRTEHRL